MAARRINKEWNDIVVKQESPHIKSLIRPEIDNILRWEANIEGPKGTPYENGIFRIDIRFPNDYPFKSPHLKFITPIYSCNLSESGHECLDIGYH